MVGNMCPCLDGYFDNPNFETCLNCHYSCKTCDGALETDCLSCDVNVTTNRLVVSAR